MDPCERPPRLFVAALLAVHAVLLLVSAQFNFVTVDESSYIPAGLWHWQTGGFELYRVNPPLPRMLATLPLLAMDLDTDYGPLPSQPGDRPEWEAGPQLRRRQRWPLPGSAVAGTAGGHRLVAAGWLVGVPLGRGTVRGTGRMPGSRVVVFRAEHTRPRPPDHSRLANDCRRCRGLLRLLALPSQTHLDPRLVLRVTAGLACRPSSPG